MMKHMLRTALLALVLLVPGAAPASAAGGGAFYGTAFIECFGCGLSRGWADVCAYYASTGGTGLCTHVHADFTANEPPATCPVQGSATGFMSDGLAFNENFAWTRVGVFAVITATGTITGDGWATFVVTGNPCGGPANATVFGAMFGS
jgi:hypothetical protein